MLCGRDWYPPDVIFIISCTKSVDVVCFSIIPTSLLQSVIADILVHFLFSVMTSDLFVSNVSHVISSSKSIE